MPRYFDPNDYDILTVPEWRLSGREMTELVVGQLTRGWTLHYNVTTFRAFVLQTIVYSGDDAPLPYKLKLAQGSSANDLVTKVRDLERDGWKPYMGTVSSEVYLYQWMIRELAPNQSDKPMVEHVVEADLASVGIPSGTA